MALDAAEPFRGFDHSGGAPPQSHGAVSPPFHVRRMVAADADHGLDRVRRPQRSGQYRRHVESGDGERLGESFAQTGGRAGMGWAFSNDGTVATERRVWAVSEAARVLGISHAHAYELVARRELPHLRLGRRIVILCHALDELLDQT